MITPHKFVALCHEAEARFWPKVDRSGGPDACWPWQAADDGKGRYGKFKIASHEKAATHRVAYALMFGPIDHGLDVLHRCDNPPCCNPGHLFLGDHYDNMADMRAKGRAKGGSGPGEDSHAAKLSAADVEQIRARIAAGESNTAIARDYPITHYQVSRIRRGKAWGDGTPMQPRYASLRSVTRDFASRPHNAEGA